MSRFNSIFSPMIMEKYFGHIHVYKIMSLIRLMKLLSLLLMFWLAVRGWYLVVSIALCPLWMQCRYYDWRNALGQVDVYHWMHFSPNSACAKGF